MWQLKVNFFLFFFFLIYFAFVFCSLFFKEMGNCEGFVNNIKYILNVECGIELSFCCLCFSSNVVQKI